MTYWKISDNALVEPLNLRSLRAAWRLYGETMSYRVLKPLTDAQLQRLPSGLRALLIVG